MLDKTRISNRGWLLILLAVTLVWFSNLEFRKLVRPDEGRYAEIPREMVASGDWLTPRLDGYKYFEKPALQYWATATAYEAFGERHWTSRLWPALTGLFAVLATIYCGWRVFGREAGIYAGLVLGSAFLYVVMAHVDTLDMGVTAFMTLTLCAWLLALRDGATAAETRNWMWLAWAAAGLALLSKGLQGLVLPGAVFIVYTLVERDYAPWKKLHPVTGLAIFLLITAPWFIAVSIANPEFPHFFFIHEHFERFLTKEHHRYQPFYYFIGILLAGMLPWTVMALDGLLAAWRAEPALKFRPLRFLLIWSAFIFVFFSASGSKLPPYILPIFPSLALLLGVRLPQLTQRRFTLSVVPVIALALGGLAFAPFLPRFASEETPPALFEAYMPWMMGACLVAVVACIAAIAADRRRSRELAVLLLAGGGLLLAQIGLTGHDSFAPSSSSYYLVSQAKPVLVRDGLSGQPDVPFYSVGMYEQTLPFYIERTVTLVAHEDELEFGIGVEPQKYIRTVEEFEQRWRADRRALAIMQPDRYRELAAAGLPMRLVARDTRRVIVAKP
jgi:4-amino-4-deoxy-L-arabinose transferase-like glycosyltransferase